MSALRIHGIVLSGVGGQGVLSLAQIVLEALRRSGFHALQSEIHGMSQRGGSVQAQVCFAEVPLTSPILDEGSADLLIALEPLEDIYRALKAVRGACLLDTEDLARRLRHPQAGGMALLGMASRHLPVPEAVWQAVITERFAAKGERVITKNLEAFAAGQGLVPARAEA